jgi:hypothetical protein
MLQCPPDLPGNPPVKKARTVASERARDEVDRLLSDAAFAPLDADEETAPAPCPVPAVQIPPTPESAPAGTCPICMNLAWRAMVLPRCGHTFCRGCAERVWGTHDKLSEPCPLCRLQCSNLRPGDATTEPRPNYAARDLLRASAGEAAVAAAEAAWHAQYPTAAERLTKWFADHPGWTVNLRCATSLTAEWQLHVVRSAHAFAEFVLSRGRVEPNLRGVYLVSGQAVQGEQGRMVAYPRRALHGVCVKLNAPNKAIGVVAWPVVDVDQPPPPFGCTDAEYESWRSNSVLRGDVDNSPADWVSSTH